jgi:hypothetical protein
MHLESSRIFTGAKEDDDSAKEAEKTVATELKVRRGKTKH